MHIPALVCEYVPTHIGTCKSECVREGMDVCM